jgi:hypothetical protein
LCVLIIIVRYDVIGKKAYITAFLSRSFFLYFLEFLCRIKSLIFFV